MLARIVLRDGLILGLKTCGLEFSRLSDLQECDGNHAEGVE
jgi:hypothetical protein